MVERLSVPSTDHISFQHRVGARWQQQLGSPQACTVAAPLVRSHDIPTNAKESKEFNDITCRYTFVHTAQLTLAKRRLPQTSRYFRTTIGSFQSQSQLPTLPFAIQSPMIPRIPAPCLFGNIALKLSHVSLLHGSHGSPPYRMPRILVLCRSVPPPHAYNVKWRSTYSDVHRWVCKAQSPDSPAHLVLHTSLIFHIQLAGV